MVLVQFDKDDTYSRTYIDFDTLKEALDGICQMYEQKLQIKKDEESSYTLNDLIAYIDGLADFSCLTFNDVQKVYVPHGRDWIKTKLYMSLKKCASKVE